MAPFGFGLHIPYHLPPVALPWEKLGSMLSRILGGSKSRSERFGVADYLLLLLHYWLFNNVCTSYFQVSGLC